MAALVGRAGAGTGSPGKSPIALRVRLDGASPANPSAVVPGRLPGFDLTEAGTRKRLAVHVVRDPQRDRADRLPRPRPPRPGLRRRRPRRGCWPRSRQQVKGLLRDQSVLAGVGNAYSDEVLHAARLSPFAISGKLTDEQVERLSSALHEVLDGAVAAASGKPAAELKDAKRQGMRVHGRTGQTCPVCGDMVREVSFADSSLQYCATCQTGGKPLADRRLSRLLK